jgi:predicted lipoprotein with Yx(FWY)xxD motif
MMTRQATTLMTMVLLLVAACGGGSGGNTPTTTAGTGTTTPQTVNGIHGSDTSLGTVLANPDGFTLYAFTNDTAGESTCYDACADLWPAVSADTPIASDLDATLFGSTTRTDGSEQLTVDGRPLYTYRPDTSPGDTNGQGFNGVWFVVGTDGSLIGGPEAGIDEVTTQTTVYGYDY